MSQGHAKMRVERLYTDQAFHPDRRRVKIFTIHEMKDGEGRVVMSEWVGDYPILWSRRIGDGERLVVLLVDDQQGICFHARMDEADFAKLPETDIEW